MKKNILNIEIRLLIEKYGYKTVLSSLSEIKNTSLEEIESLMVSLESKKTSGRKQARKKTELELAEKTISGSENSELLIELGKRFQNKTFLPQLKDVKRMFERSRIDSSNIKSRHSSTVKLFELLKRMSKHELEALLSEVQDNSESAFSALSKEIIGGQPNKPSNNGMHSDGDSAALHPRR